MGRVLVWFRYEHFDLVIVSSCGDRDEQQSDGEEVTKSQMA